MEMMQAVSTVGLGGKDCVFFHPSAIWISLGPRCDAAMWSSVEWFTHRVRHAAHL